MANPTYFASRFNCTPLLMHGALPPRHNTAPLQGAPPGLIIPPPPSDSQMVFATSILGSAVALGEFDPFASLLLVLRRELIMELI